MSFNALSPRLSCLRCREYLSSWTDSHLAAQRSHTRHTKARKRRCLSSQAASAELQDKPANKYSVIPPPVAWRARQKQAHKEFFVDILSSAATKRDAKAYLSRLKSPKKHSIQHETLKQTPKDRPSYSHPEVNVGNLFGRARAVDEAPIFSQSVQAQKAAVQELETLHVALVKIKGLETFDSYLVDGIAQTLSQLAKLSMTPCVVLEASTPSTDQEVRRVLTEQADRLIAAIEETHMISAWRMDSILGFSEDSQNIQVVLRNILLRPLQKSRVPVILPFAISATDQTSTLVPANDALLALANEFAGLNLKAPVEEDPLHTAQRYRDLQKQVSLDRVILIDEAGGLPSARTDDSHHIFVNMEQEYEELHHDLTASQSTQSTQHLSNLNLLRDLLQLLPPSSSALITTPAEAANVAVINSEDSGVSSVGTRRQKNALIHNLLTDKPAYSASLPLRRLPRSSSMPSVISSTFVKKGMSLTILPDALDRPWSPDNYGESRLKLTDPRIDLPRLVHLINDSFGRELDVEQYLHRVNDRMAGVIIAGEYEGGALLTWETPPGASSTDTARLVPYLDKFAVLKRSQGAGGVADILFNAMVRTCFPHGVCWRSRKDNPVNKWYFERSKGTWKIPDMNWTMFWTTPDVFEGDQVFSDYEGVCRGVAPTWKDKKLAAD